MIRNLPKNKNKKKQRGGFGNYCFKDKYLNFLTWVPLDNKIHLHFLAEQGGVCSVVNISYCTWIKHFWWNRDGTGWNMSTGQMVKSRAHVHLMVPYVFSELHSGTAFWSGLFFRLDFHFVWYYRIFAVIKFYLFYQLHIIKTPLR